MSDDLFADLDAILDDPMFDGENIDHMTADELRDFARRRVARARDDDERRRIMMENEMLAMLAMARESGF